MARCGTEYGVLLALLLVPALVLTVRGIHKLLLRLCETAGVRFPDTGWLIAYLAAPCVTAAFLAALWRIAQAFAAG